MTEPTRHLKLREAIGLASDLGQLVKLAEIAAFVYKIKYELTADDYLQHGQLLKHVVDRHGQLIQAMSRLNAQAGTAQIIETTRESLTWIAHQVEEVRKARTAARQASHGCEAN
jgi:hypothetical protein